MEGDYSDDATRSQGAGCQGPLQDHKFRAVTEASLGPDRLQTA